jgi:hypothetical protein
MAVCFVCGGGSSSGTPLRCGHCGKSFCEGHADARSHGCRGTATAGCHATERACPKCGCDEFLETYLGTVSDTPVQERSLDWETKLLWWFKAPDFIPFETIERVDGAFCLQRIEGGKARKCKKCGHESGRDAHAKGPD